MAGGINGLLNIANSSLQTQTQAIRVLGSNIANVNTPGYSRRKPEINSLTPQGPQEAALGTGVELSRVSQLVDQFVNANLRGKMSDSAKADARALLLGRAESSFSLDSDVGQIGVALSEFFGALDDLALNPQSIPLRSKVLESGQKLVATISSSFNNIAELQREADTRLGTAVTEVNRLTAQIADINKKIAATEVGDQEHLTLRDQRGVALQDLAKLISFTTIEDSQGRVSVSLADGFGLVTGERSRSLEMTAAPTFAPVGGYPPGMDGSALRHIVFDFDPTAGTSHADYTSVLAAGSGEIAGLLTARGVQSDLDNDPFDAVGDLVSIGSRVEAIAQVLLTSFNMTYLGTTDEDTTTPAYFDPNSGGLNTFGPVTNNPDGSIFSLFTFTGANAASDADADGQPELTDLSAVGFASYASRLQFAVPNEESLAAAIDFDPIDGSILFLPGDGTNAARVAALRNTLHVVSVGNYSSSGITIEDIYNETVVAVGGMADRANDDLKLAQDKEAATLELQQSISGVNIDEEFAKLIAFQRAFEASARMIRTGDDLLGQIMQLVG